MDFLAHFLISQRWEYPVKSPSDKSMKSLLTIIAIILFTLFLFFIWAKGLGLDEKLTAKEFFLQEKVKQVIACESQGIHKINGELLVGDRDYVYQAKGVAQFQERTFLYMSKLAGKELNYESEQDQRFLLRWAIENDLGENWSCYTNQITLTLK